MKKERSIDSGADPKRNIVPNALRLTDISSNHLALLAWVLQRDGHDVDAIFAEVGVSVPSANNPLDRVPLVTVLRLLERLQEVSGDPCAGLNLYRRMKLGHLNVLGFALGCSSTLLDFFERAQRFCVYIGSAFLITVEAQDDHYRILGKWNPEVYREQLQGESHTHRLLECLGYSALGIIQDLFGESLPIRVIYLPKASHAKVVEGFETLSKAPVRTVADFVGCEIDAGVMRARLPGANPQLALQNDLLLIEQLAVSDDANIVHRCEQIIIDGMPTGEYTLTQVAQRLGTSERVLQQSLKAQGQSFSGVVNRIKKSLATQYLQDSRKNIAQIAYALGFDSPSNFSRAFRSWTGCSPRDYKIRHRKRTEVSG